MAKPKKPVDSNFLSPFARALAELNEDRHVEWFDVSGFFGPGAAAKAIPKIGIRIPTKAEQDRAVAAAHKYVHKVSLAAHPASDAVKSDRDVVVDAKNAAIIFEFCRSREEDPEEPSGFSEWCAFPSPDWACENLTPEQIATLLNLANEVRFKNAGSPLGMDDETVEDYIAVCITQNNPEMLLIALTREYLVQLQILTAAKLGASRREVKLLADENAMLRARLAHDEDVVIKDADWTAAGIRYPVPGAPPGAPQRYLIAGRDPEGFFHYGPREGIYLAVLDHAPQHDEIRAFLDLCLAGEVDSTSLADLAPPPAPEAPAAT